MLPGGSGLPPFSRLADFRQSASPYPPASRVSISELLGGLAVMNMLQELERAMG